MQSNIKISCDIGTTNGVVPLGLEIWLDHTKLMDLDHVSQSCKFQHELPDTEAEHELRFVLKNKLATHTTIDESGNIVSDACLTIDNMAFDEIALGNLFTELSTYTHDFNGTGQLIQDKFFGAMGCNGTVSLKFSTPMYLWLLENL